MRYILTKKYNKEFTFSLIKKCFEIGSDKIIEEVKNSCLLGRGGALFPTGIKWEFVKNQDGEKFVVCNAEEGELYTFKDKFILKNFPYKVIDGMIVASIAVGAQKGFIYVNQKYKNEIRILENLIKEYKKESLLGKKILSTNHNFDIEIIESNGRYITGEETALFNIIEGKRPTPRLKPPYPTQKGLFNKPTLINNVETFSFIPQIIFYGSEWFKNIGVEKSYGTKLICLTVDNKKVGVFEIELGKIRVCEIIKKYAKLEPKNVKAFLPSASSQLLFPEKFGIQYDFESLKNNGTSLGTAGIFIFSKNFYVFDEIKKIVKFFSDESCGYCVPCRIGLKRIYEKLCSVENLKKENLKKEVLLIKKLSLTIKETSRCALGQNALNPLISYIKKIEDGKYKNLY
mgnify:CR=1 FL=1